MNLAKTQCKSLLMILFYFPFFVIVIHLFLSPTSTWNDPSMLLVLTSSAVLSVLAYCSYSIDSTNEWCEAKILNQQTVVCVCACVRVLVCSLCGCVRMSACV